LFKNRAPYLLIDEIDKMSRRDQTFLFNLMETGILAETKYGKTREAEIKISVFATCNDPRKLSAPLQSRFFIIELEPYTHEEFYEITVHLLEKDFARYGTYKTNECLVSPLAVSHTKYKITFLAKVPRKIKFCVQKMP
jgi:MoxR-like ATPase